MIYTALTNKAMKIAYDAHHGQLDCNGVPYIFHPYHLAEQMTEEEAVCVALLHDVVEDSSYTLADLEAMGFPKTVVEGIALMTHDPAVPYMEYVTALGRHPVARAVKLADLAHNSDLSRMDADQIDEWALKRTEKYKKAIEMLS